MLQRMYFVIIIDRAIILIFAVLKLWLSSRSCKLASFLP